MSVRILFCGQGLLVWVLQGIWAPNICPLRHKLSMSRSLYQPGTWTMGVPHFLTTLGFGSTIPPVNIEQTGYNYLSSAWCLSATTASTHLVIVLVRLSSLFLQMAQL